MAEEKEKDMNNLFLEGPFEEGKSTLLRQQLEPYKDRLGGLITQRLIDKDTGVKRGHRITDAEKWEPLEIDFDPGLTGIFIAETDGEIYKDKKVFLSEGVGYLKKAASKQLILLDEIGGMEMTLSIFRETIYNIIDSKVPCIGVIKSLDNMEHMRVSNGMEPGYLKLNTELREKIQRSSRSAVITYSGKAKENIGRTVRSFLRENVRENHVENI